MYRKNRPNDYIEPMPKKQLQKIIRAFKKNGGLIIMSEETDKYLAKKRAEGATLNALTILLCQNPSRASVYEELIHATQYRLGENNGSDYDRIKCEIKAQKKLLKYKEWYNLTEIEIIQTKKALAAYEKELKLIKKGGVENV